MPYPPVTFDWNRLDDPAEQEKMRAWGAAVDAIFKARLRQLCLEATGLDIFA